MVVIMSFAKTDHTKPEKQASDIYSNFFTHLNLWNCLTDIFIFIPIMHPHSDYRNMSS